MPVTGGHPFYQRLNQVLGRHAFEEFVKAQCAPFYATTRGRPSLTPGTYFRLLFRVLRGHRFGTRHRVAHGRFPGAPRDGLDEATPEHSTISRMRRLMSAFGSVYGKTRFLPFMNGRFWKHPESPTCSSWTLRSPKTSRGPGRVRE